MLAGLIVSTLPGAQGVTVQNAKLIMARPPVLTAGVADEPQHARVHRGPHCFWWPLLTALQRSNADRSIEQRTRPAPLAGALHIVCRFGATPVSPLHRAACRRSRKDARATSAPSRRAQCRNNPAAAGPRPRPSTTCLRPAQRSDRCSLADLGISDHSAVLGRSAQGPL